jgi:hypothetical protein
MPLGLYIKNWGRTPVQVDCDAALLLDAQQPTGLTALGRAALPDLALDVRKDPGIVEVHSEGIAEIQAPPSNQLPGLAGIQIFSLPKDLAVVCIVAEQVANEGTSAPRRMFPFQPGLTGRPTEWLLRGFFGQHLAPIEAAARTTSWSVERRVYERGVKKILWDSRFIAIGPHDGVIDYEAGIEEDVEATARLTLRALLQPRAEEDQVAHLKFLQVGEWLLTAKEVPECLAEDPRLRVGCASRRSRNRPSLMPRPRFSRLRVRLKPLRRRIWLIFGPHDLPPRFSRDGPTPICPNGFLSLANEVLPAMRAAVPGIAPLAVVLTSRMSE